MVVRFFINKNLMLNTILIQVCFVSYKQVQLDDVYLDGCKYLNSETLASFKRWFLPDWLKIVQILTIAEIGLLLLTLKFIFIGLLTKLRNEFIFIIVISIMTTVLSNLFNV